MKVCSSTLHVDMSVSVCVCAGALVAFEVKDLPSP